MPDVHQVVVGQGELVVGDTLRVISESHWLAVTAVVTFLLALLHHDGQNAHVLDLTRLLEPIPQHNRLVTQLYPKTSQTKYKLTVSRNC